MGVNGLLVLLKSIQRSTNLKAYAGQTLGVDGYGWLHKGAFACALHLALDRPTTMYIDYVLKYVQMLRDFGVTPYVVFDGDALPSKAFVNADRKVKRESAKKNGLELWRTGKQKEAMKEFQKAVAITPDMTYKLIRELRKRNIAYVVAPYEADAQLVYLEGKGIIDGIISEDSDLLVFGARRLITKLDDHGNCIEIDRRDIHKCKDVTMAGWSDTMFRDMAILSGCDYLANIPRMGLKTAHTYMKKYKDGNRVINTMALTGYSVPADYPAQFRDAQRSFLYHRVFCPEQKRMTHLNEIPPGIDVQSMPFLGQHVADDVVIGVACGDLNPRTKEPHPPSSTFAKPSTPAAKTPSAEGEDVQGLKSKRSIDSFFKPHRTPLAELDPNSLTPTPSQQRLLERNRNVSWEPRPINSAPQLRRAVTDLISTPRLSDAREHHTSAWMQRASVKSNFQPVKRLRLCSDTDLSPAKEMQKSRFFADVAPAQSPLTVKKARNRASNKAKFDLWSDDTVEEIMGHLEQTEQRVIQEARTRTQDTMKKSPEAKKDDVQEIPPSSPVQQVEPKTDSQSSHGTIQLKGLGLESREGSFTASDSTEVSSQSNPEKFSDLLNQHIHTINETLQSKRKQRTFSQLSPVQQLSALRNLRSPSPEAEVRLRPSSPAKSRPKTPTSSKGPSIHALAKTFVYQSPERQARAFASLVPAVKDQHIVSTTKAAAHITTSSQTMYLHPKAGSEDALCQNSDDEFSEVGQMSPRHKLDLGLFRYDG